MKKISVFLVDDHQLVRDGIKWQFNKSNNIEITGEATNEKELTELLKISVPDVILLDLTFHEISCISLIMTISLEYPSTKVLILTDHSDEGFIFEAIKAGARGFLSKKTSRKELLEAILQINNGNDFLGLSVSEIIVESFIRRAKSGENYNNDKTNQLTSRELEIIKLVAEGASNQEIAEKLFISIRTVNSHKNHIMKKLDIESPVDLIKYAVKNKLIDFN